MKKKSKGGPEDIRRIYYNEKVIEFLEWTASMKVFCGGRGSGKTRAIPEDILDRAAALPRARIFLAAYDFDTVNDNIMPDMRDVFELRGLIEGQHYVIDMNAPKWFEKPYKQLQDTRNSISFCNGFVVQKIALGRLAKKYRGRSFDGGIIDEALILDGYLVENILMPTLRGLDRWGGNPYWKMLSVYSSFPRTVEGSWFLKYKDLAKVSPKEYKWQEATAFDNLAVLGEDYIERQRIALNHIDFQIEIMNRGDMRDLPTLFYYQLRAARHYYKQENFKDIDPDRPLDLSFDFGGRYSCLTVSQEHGEEERYVYEFDTNNLTEEEKIMGIVKKVPDLVKEFMAKFKTHRNRYVRLYGEKAGLDRQSMDDRNIFQQIADMMVLQDWQPDILVSYTDAALHKTRYSFMNTCLEEQTPDYPAIRINVLTCPNLKESLEKTKVTDDFKKDKRNERNDRYNQSHAPHLSDTVDYKIFNKYFYLLDEEGFGFSGGGGIDSV